ncbi:MAG: SPOR domain-containing protein [Nitrosomonas halophila]
MVKKSCLNLTLWASGVLYLLSSQAACAQTGQASDIQAQYQKLFIEQQQAFERQRKFILQQRREIDQLKQEIDQLSGQPFAPAVDGLNPGYGQAWLQRLDPKSFTLQLSASVEEKALLDLAVEENITEAYAIYLKTVNGKRWYVLVSGCYASNRAALQAIANLPPSLKKNQPWPVSIRSILAQL